MRSPKLNLNLISDPLLHLVVLGVCISTLLGIILLNVDTPIRGEHWALLYGFVNSPTFIDKIKHSFSFVLFGDHRFQPFNMLPLILEYLVFDFQFIYYSLVSVALHLIYSLAFVHVIHALNHFENSESKPFQFKNYLLEYSLVLVLFISIDVITWSFYQYIQIAASLALFAVARYLKNYRKNQHSHYVSYLLIALSMLFYEPFYAILVVLLLHQLRNYFTQNIIKTRNEIIFLGILVLGFGFKYLNSTLSKAITIPPNVSQIHGLRLYTGHDSLFLANGASYKPLFLIYNYVLWLLNVFGSILFPANSHQVNLYELTNFQLSLQNQLPWISFSLILVALIGIYYIGQKLAQGLLEKYLLLISINLFIFAMIALGRPGAGNYSTVQFRYTYILFPFIAIPLLHLLRPLKAGKAYSRYSSGILALIFINMGSSLNQGFRLKNEMRPVAQFIKNLKTKRYTHTQIVNLTSKAIMDYSFPVIGQTVFLIYNARGGLAYYYKEPNA